MSTSGPNSVTIVQVQNMPAKSIPLLRGTSEMSQTPKPSVLIGPNSKAGGEIKYRTRPSNFSVQTMQLQLRTVSTHFLSIDYEAGSLRTILWDPFFFFLCQPGFLSDHHVAVVYNTYCFLLNLLFHSPSSWDQEFHVLDTGGWGIECLHKHVISWGSIMSMEFICFIHTLYT